MIIEVCANSYSSALIAQVAGAHRIELCQDLLLGGTTPSAGTILQTRQTLQIPIFVLIRPRSGDFVYDENELEIIKSDILFCKKNSIDGVVIGQLSSDGHVDIEQTQQLIELAYPMSVTFHRAFDRTKNPLQTMETLIDIGINRILTSGQAATAFEGKNVLQKLVEKSKGRIEILAGGGININNVVDIIQTSKVQEVHLSGKTLIKSPFTQKGIMLNAGAIPEQDYYRTDEAKIRAVIEKIKVL